MATDSAGIPLNICISGGQEHESQFAEQLLDGIGVLRSSGHLKQRPDAVLADKGYSSRKIRKYLKRRGIKVVIPYKSNEKACRDCRCKVDFQQYKDRNVVERCFGFLKEFRRIATRSEKTARNYLAMLKLGSIRLFIRRLFN